jgi:hypothetical protein
MGRNRSTRSTQVVIVRKDKRLNRPFHLLAFMLTGGMSAPLSATRAATNAGYNARTRHLSDTSSAVPTSRASRAAFVPTNPRAFRTLDSGPASTASSSDQLPE